MNSKIYLDNNVTTKMEKVKTYKLINGKRVDTGKTYTRDSAWTEDESDFYIVGINNWIINSEGKFLIQRRALTKKNNPGKWSSTNGLIQLEESNWDAVQRETKEELGLNINKNQIFLFEENHIVGNHLMVDIFITYADVDIKDITVQESEVDKVCFVSLDELLKLDVSSTCSYIKELAPKMYEQYKKI